MELEQIFLLIIILIIIFVIIRFILASSLRSWMGKHLLKSREIESTEKIDVSISKCGTKKVIVRKAFGIPDIVEEVWKNLPKGQILFNPPSTMKMGTKERIEVRIANKLTDDLEKDLKGRGDSQLENIKVSPQMKVQLDGGDAFEIKKLFNSETMAIVGSYTQWDWEVTPLKNGIQKLLLYVSGIIEVKDYSDRSFCIPAFEKEITVRVNYNYLIKNFLKDYWQWIIGTVLIIAGLVIAYFDYWKP